MNSSSADDLPAIEWTDEIAAETFPLTCYRKQRQSVAEVKLAYPCRLSKYPITQGAFEAFVKDTGQSRIAGYWQQESSNEPLTRVFCTQVLPFCDWLNKKYQEHHLLPAGWRIDLPLQDEWAVAIQKFNLDHDEPKAIFVSVPPVLFEWCWVTPAHILREDIPDGNDDWRIVLGWFASCVFLRNVSWTTDISPTWEDNYGFRVACRQTRP